MLTISPNFSLMYRVHFRLAKVFQKQQIIFFKKRRYKDINLFVKVARILRHFVQKNFSEIQCLSSFAQCVLFLLELTFLLSFFPFFPYSSILLSPFPLSFPLSLSFSPFHPPLCFSFFFCIQ